MKTRVLAVGLAILAIGFAACGGGGSSGGGSTPPATGGGGGTVTVPTPTPTPTPYALGDSLTYGGSQTTMATYAYPSPSPYPPTNTTVSVTQQTSVLATPNLAIAPVTAGDFHTLETDVAALTTHTATTDAWVGLSGANLVEYGYVTVDDSGDSLHADYVAPVTLDQLPETNGASWSNPATLSYIEQDADGTNSVRTYAADGSYTDSLSNSASGVSATITENADGSGAYLGPFGSGFYSGFTLSAPSNSQVTVMATFPQSPAPAPTPEVFATPPAWYGSSSPTLYSQNTVVTTGIGYPAGCSVPAAYGTTGNELVQTTNRLDTILGYTDVQTQTTYTDAQYAAVCVVLSDVQKDYYDYQDDYASFNGTNAYYHYHFPGTLLSTTTMSQTLTLQSGAVVHGVARRTQASSSALSFGRVAAVFAAFDLRVQHARVQREKRFVRFMSQLGRKEVR